MGTTSLGSGVTRSLHDVRGLSLAECSEPFESFSVNVCQLDMSGLLLSERSGAKPGILEASCDSAPTLHFDRCGVNVVPDLAIKEPGPR